MTFLEMQDAVLERFAEVDRTNAKRWINLAGATIWNAGNWVFKKGVSSSLTTTAGSADLGDLPTDLGKVHGIWTDEGISLTYLDEVEFENTFKADTINGITGTPAYYSFGSFPSINLAPMPSVTSSSYSIRYTKRYTDLVADGDISPVPDELHWVQVAAAMSIGQSHQQDPTAALLDPVVAGGINSMRMDYLSNSSAPRYWGG